MADIIKTGSNSSVIIKPKNTEQKADITKKYIKEKINPAEISVNNGIRKVGKGGIVIDCTNKQDSEKLIKEIKDNLSDSYEIKEAAYKKPINLKYWDYQQKMKIQKLKIILKSKMLV